MATAPPVSKTAGVTVAGKSLAWVRVSVKKVEIPALSQVDVESQVASVERALNSYKQKQKPKLSIINYGEPHNYLW